MPALRECTPTRIWVCLDCYQAHHGITEHERGEPYPADPAPLSQITDAADVTAGMMPEHHDTPCGSFDSSGGDFLGGECECEQVTFTWSACEGCGSTLGGSREALTVWYPIEEATPCT